MNSKAQVIIIILQKNKISFWKTGVAEKQLGPETRIVHFISIMDSSVPLKLKIWAQTPVRTFRLAHML